MSLLVDNPILNSPFEEPTRYWDYGEDQPVLVEGRHPTILKKTDGKYVSEAVRLADTKNADEKLRK